MDRRPRTADCGPTMHGWRQLRPRIDSEDARTNPRQRVDNTDWTGKTLGNLPAPTIHSRNARYLCTLTDASSVGCRSTENGVTKMIHHFRAENDFGSPSRTVCDGNLRQICERQNGTYFGNTVTAFWPPKRSVTKWW